MSGSIRIVVLVLSLTGCTCGNSDDAAPPPPPTRVETVVDTIHGVEIPDDYRWLEDQDSPETRGWIEAQNAYTWSSLGNRPERPAIARRVEELLRIDQVGSPRQRENRYCLWKKRADDDLWIFHMRDGLDGEE
ncbi:MAG: hypothetical protein MI919_09990, partial [Holophagales bacterium]|nr:hypothetical protein [Holophagales bacterium]